jgi:hypothetical protein
LSSNVWLLKLNYGTQILTNVCEDSEPFDNAVSELDAALEPELVFEELILETQASFDSESSTF